MWELTKTERVLDKRITLPEELLETKVSTGI